VPPADWTTTAALFAVVGAAPLAGLAWLLRRGQRRLAAAHRQLAAELRASREVFRVLARNAPVGILQADTRGQCTFANDAWLEFTGLTLVETLGHEWSRSVHPEDLPGVMAEWARCVGSQEDYVHACRLLRRDGTVREVVAAALPIRDETGTVTGFIGTVTDVSERRAAERHGRMQELLLRGLTDHAAVLAHVRDLAGRYLFVNRHYARLFPSVRVGMTAADCFPADVVRAFADTDAQVRDTRRPVVSETPVPHADGTVHDYVTVKFPIIDDRDALVAIGGVSTDISALKRAHADLTSKEQVLRRLIEVQENEKQALCHEFHDGLIQYAVGALMLLESRPDGDDDETLGAVIRCLRRGIDDGRRVIRGIRPCVLDDLGLVAAIEELATHLAPLGVAVERDLAPGLDALPESLQTTVYRVVQEALNNVHKHAATTRAEVVIRRGGAGLEIVVRDAGGGCDPAAACQSGFGLVGMRERVRLAGGECRFESAPGAGMTVRVSLPNPPAAPTTAPAAVAAGT